MATQLPHENLNWITNGEPGTGSPDGSTPDGVLNRPIKQNLENIKQLRDTFNEEHTDSGQHTTSMLKSKLDSAITDDEIASNAHINESKLDLLLKGKTRPGGGTYSNSGELAEDVLSWVTLRNQVPTRAEFEAFAERVRRAMAGSGFVEWGSCRSGYPVIQNGMWILRFNNTDYLYIGNATDSSIVSVNGYLLKLSFYEEGKDIGRIRAEFPSPPSSPDQLYRQDLVFLECWHEDVSEKDIVFPYGNVHYRSDLYNAPDGTSFSTTSITDLGIAQGYSAFGQWDSDTVGRGIRWSSLTEEQKKSFASDPWNNIYVDGDKVIQVRYRIRVVSSPSDVSGKWHILEDLGLYWYYVSGDPLNKFVIPQGKKTMPKDLDVGGGYDGYFRYTSLASAWFNSIQTLGCFYAITGFRGLNTTVAYDGLCFAIPIAIVARRNTGAFHPVYNPNGSALFSGGKKFWEVSIPTPTSYDIVGVNIEDTDEDGTNDLFQFIVSGDQTESIKKGYLITVSNSTDNDGIHWVTNVEYDSDNDQTIITVSNEMSSTTADGSLYSDFGYVKYCFDHADISSGTIESGVSGRPDGLYADEINEGDVKDLRNYAPRVTDYQRVLEKEFNKLLQGKMRGWEKAPSNYIRPVQVFVDKEDNVTAITMPSSHISNGSCGRDIWIGAEFEYQGNRYKLFTWSNQYYNEVKKWNGSSWESGAFFELVANLIDGETNQLLSNPVPVYKFVRPPLEAPQSSFASAIKYAMTSYYSGTFSYKRTCNWFYKNILVRDTLEFIIGDYGESFIPTDDFSASVNPTDNTRITISGDKTYAIKKNCRLFFRDSANNKAGTLRVKTITYDSADDQTVITTTVESGDSMVTEASIKVSTCIAGGQTGEVSEGNQVYVFKLSRKPKNNKVKVLIKKKDGSWFAFNSFDNVNVYNSTSMQRFINNTGSMDEEVRFNSYLNWLAINISKIYSTLGYSDEDDFKQNAVIEVYYVTEANPLELDSGSHESRLVYLSDWAYFCGFGYEGNNPVFSRLVLQCIGKGSEKMGGTVVPETDWSQIKNTPRRDLVYYPGYQQIAIDLRVSNNKHIGGAFWPVLLKNNGKLYLNVSYNEIICDYEVGMNGWEGALLVADYETTSTDANGNTFIAGQKSVELPYFVWNEDED